jgi:hypothetical protein
LYQQQIRNHHYSHYYLLILTHSIRRHSFCVCGIFSSSHLPRSASPATPTPSPRAGGGKGRKKERTRASKPQGNRQANLVASQPFSLTGAISPKTEIKNKIK